MLGGGRGRGRGEAGRWAVGRWASERVCFGVRRAGGPASVDPLHQTLWSSPEHQSHRKLPRLASLHRAPAIIGLAELGWAWPPRTRTTSTVSSGIRSTHTVVCHASPCSAAPPVVIGLAKLGWTWPPRTHTTSTLHKETGPTLLSLFKIIQTPARSSRPPRAAPGPWPAPLSARPAARRPRAPTGRQPPAARPSPPAPRPLPPPPTHTAGPPAGRRRRRPGPRAYPLNCCKTWARSNMPGRATCQNFNFAPINNNV